MPQTRIVITAAMLACATASAAQAAVIISSAATENMACSAGVCTPTAADATLNVGDLENLLASGAVKVTTTGSGVQANDFEISAALTWSTANTLALDSYHSITINQPVSVDGSGGLTLTTNDGGSNGSLAFGHKGHATFQNLSDQLTINGATYTLVNSIQSLASAVAANPSGAYALANSYDASEDGTYNAAPVNTGFTGSFEGLGNSVSHLSIKGSGYIGLFEVEYGTAENLSVLDVDYIVSGGSQAGAFAGVAADVSRVHVSGTIRGNGDMGNNIGGLTAVSGTLTECSANVQIAENSGGQAGGLVSLSAGVVQSFASGNVLATGEGSEAGGLVATNTGQIEDSYATGAVKGGLHSRAGGFIGTNGEAKHAIGAVETSYSAGAVTGKYPSRAGGFAGVAYADHGQDVIEQSYWDTTTSGINKAVGKGDKHGISGLTSNQMQSGLPAGFDPKIWAESPNINNGLPYLINNPPEK